MLSFDSRHVQLIWIYIYINVKNVTVKSGLPNIWLYVFIYIIICEVCLNISNGQLEHTTAQVFLLSLVLLAFFIFYKC